MTETLERGEHQVLAGLGGARLELSAALEANAWSLTDGQVAAAVRQVAAARAQCDALLIALLREVLARDIAHAASATPAAWLRDLARLDPREARALVRLAEQIDPSDGTDPVGAAMAAGTVSVPHAHVITTTLAALPATAEPAIREQAAELLAEQAAILTPRELTRAGREIHERIAARHADVDDPAEAARLAAEADRDAADRHDRRQVSLRQRRDGM